MQRPQTESELIYADAKNEVYSLSLAFRIKLIPILLNITSFPGATI